MEKSRCYLVFIRREYVRDVQVKLSSQGDCHYSNEGNWRDFYGEVIIGTSCAETILQAIEEMAKKYEIEANFLAAYILSK